ncbi:IS66-Spn1 transposase [Streptococcus pneumoniae]|nr:IS66-Spn1 transposase [Streptococcus pneumoniae]SNF63026.1 IS66-Spn1 transposase [Streptococcus pneumoniae]
MYDYLVVVLVSLAHSFGSVSIIAHTIHQKFILKVPNYR